MSVFSYINSAKRKIKNNDFTIDSIVKYIEVNEKLLKVLSNKKIVEENYEILFNKQKGGADDLSALEQKIDDIYTDPGEDFNFSQIFVEIENLRTKLNNIKDELEKLPTKINTRKNNVKKIKSSLDQIL